MNLFCALEMFFQRKDGKNVIGAKMKGFCGLFWFFQKASHNLEKLLLKPGFDPLCFNFFCKIDTFKLYIA